MSVFTRLDERLEQFAAAQHAVLTRDRENQWPRSLGPLGFEERRVDWQRDGIHLAVIIQPDFGSTVVDTSKWHVRAVAWVHAEGGKRVAQRHLLRARPFSELEARVDELLAAARTFLTGLQEQDL